MLKKVSPTNPAVARAAEPHGNKIPEAAKVDSALNAKCTRRPAPAAERKPKFRLSPAVTVRFIAKIAFPANAAINL
jgi:hypothetical protein